MLCLPPPLCTSAIITTRPSTKTFCPLSSQRHLPVEETHITHEMGDTGIVRSAISQATNKKNKSPVTLPDNRCSITEPLNEHQLCTIISHTDEACSLTCMSEYLVVLQPHPSRAHHIIARQVRWRAPTPDYLTHGNFTAQLWLTLIPVTHMSGCNEAVNKLLVVSGVIQESRTSVSNEKSCTNAKDLVL